jgi:hypothetical protein
MNWWLHGCNWNNLFRPWVIIHDLMQRFLSIWRWEVVVLTGAASPTCSTRPSSNNPLPILNDHGRYSLVVHSPATLLQLLLLVQHPFYDSLDLLRHRTTCWRIIHYLPWLLRIYRCDVVLLLLCLHLSTFSSVCRKLSFYILDNLIGGRGRFNRLIG